MIPFALSILQKNTVRHICSSSFENQSDRLLSYLVTASEEYEEEYEENKNGRFRSLFIGSWNVFACLLGQFTVWVFYI